MIRRPGAAQAAVGPTSSAGPDGPRERECGPRAEVQRARMGGGPISLIRAARVQVLSRKPRSRLGCLFAQ